MLLARLIIIAMLSSSGFYGLFWLASCTPYFRDKVRLRRIGVRLALGVFAIIATVMAIIFFTSVDNSF